QQAQEITAVAVGPVHHRRDRQPSGDAVHRGILSRTEPCDHGRGPYLSRDDPERERRTMRTPARILALLLPVLAAFALAPAAAGPQPVPAPIVRTTIADGPLGPEDHYGDIAVLVRNVISRMHYETPEFDQELS